MDDGTLKALKSLTNFGYSLGMCPYKFCTVTEQQRKIKELQSAHRQNGNWFGDDQEKEDKDEESDKYKNKKPSRKRKVVKKSHVNLDQLQMEEIQTSTAQGSKVKGRKKSMMENWSLKGGSRRRRRRCPRSSPAGWWSAPGRPRRVLRAGRR